MFRYTFIPKMFQTKVVDHNIHSYV